MKTHPLTGLRATQNESLEAVKKGFALAPTSYMNGGDEDGYDLDDRFRAESEVKDSLNEF